MAREKRPYIKFIMYLIMSNSSLVQKQKFKLP